MINIFLSSFIGSIIIIGNAYAFNYLIFKKKIDEFNITNDTFFGFILIGFTSLLINFFFPVNKSISSFFLFFSVSIFIYFFIKYKKKKKSNLGYYIFNNHNISNYNFCQYKQT